MALTIWQPHRGRRRYDPMSRIFNDFWFGGPFSRNQGRFNDSAWIPAVDVRETDEAVEISAAVPGYRAEDLSVSYEDGTLILSGEQTDEQSGEQPNSGEYLRREQVRGRFYRRIRLPVSTTTEKAKARYENGVLTVRVPKTPEARGATITIETA